MEHEHLHSSFRPAAEELKERRYRDGFFNTIFSLLPAFDIIAGSCDLSINRLLQLLLENIYDEDKIDKFICEIKTFEENATSQSFRHSLIATTVLEYMRKQNKNRDIQTKVWDLVDLLSKMDLLIATVYNPIWEQHIFYIENHTNVRFYNEAFMINVCNELLVKSGADISNMAPILREYLLHKFDITIFCSKEQKQEIELILTQFYKIHCR